jgi:hypothetical protein
MKILLKHIQFRANNPPYVVLFEILNYLMFLLLHIRHEQGVKEYHGETCNQATVLSVMLRAERPR